MTDSIVRIILMRQSKVDEEINIFNNETNWYGRETDTYRIVFTPTKTRTYTFHLNCYGVEDYVRTLLNALSTDQDPYEHVQVTTATFPSVLYDVERLDSRSLQNTIVDLVMSTLKMCPQ
jgi:hypothetical protein